MNILILDNFIQTGEGKCPNLTVGWGESSNENTSFPIHQHYEDFLRS